MLACDAMYSRSEHPTGLRDQDTVQESTRGKKFSSCNPIYSVPPKGQPSPNACEGGGGLALPCTQVCHVGFQRSLVVNFPFFRGPV